MHFAKRFLYPAMDVGVARMLRIGWVAFMMLVSFQVTAQGIESIVAPGKLIQGHLKVEDDCKQCHVKFDRKAQDGLCTDCHKEIGADLRNKKGFHGQQKPQACRSCHTDHKGREARIAEFDKKKFDHTQTDFNLRGKHVKVECDKCHVTGKKFREASLECNACHRKDDIHKGSLGVKCESCHNETNWKEAKFDHDTTRFALTGKHSDVKCADCHKTNNYKEAPRNCIGCHKKDDDAKGHKGSYGEKCESCHSTKLWKPSTFKHDTDTKYVLKGAHRTTTCSSCHTGHLYRVKLSQDCYACHKKDDKHKDTLGKDCGSCHTERNWKESTKFDHDKTIFPLLGKHTKTECKDCHKSVLFKEAPKDCFSCHTKDDKHAGTLGEKCVSCHSENDWKTTQGRFKHDETRFKLRNAHAAVTVQCSACHANLKSYRNTPIDCYSCHKKNDKHEGQEGIKCDSCHDDKSWKIARFDHNISRFALTGRHITTTCKSCHDTTRFKDAPRDCYSCHQKADKHKLKFGVLCETCHNTRAWTIWDYDHEVKAKYRLDGAHRTVSCESCHKQAAPKGKNAAFVGSTCISCHRNQDVHFGRFGTRCEQCHNTDNWKKFKTRMGAHEASKPIAQGVHSFEYAEIEGDV
jgi:uncharacterized protein (DUF983 family)